MRSWQVRGLAAGGLLAVAALVACGRAGVAAPAPGMKGEPKKDVPKKEEPKKEEGKRAAPGLLFPDIDEMLKRLPPDVPPAQVQEMRKRLEQMKKRFEGMKRNPGAFPGLPGGVMPLFPGLP